MAEKTGRAEATHRERADLGHIASPMPASWPQDAEGNYLAIVTGSCSDLVPTVQFGNVLIGPVSIQRPVSAGSLQEIIDASREVQRSANFVVGVERRLLQWAVDPSSRVQSPVDGADAFAAPPPGYDPALAPPDPSAPAPPAPVAPAAPEADPAGAPRTV